MPRPFFGNSVRKTSNPAALRAGADPVADPLPTLNLKEPQIPSPTPETMTADGDSRSKNAADAADGDFPKLQKWGRKIPGD